MLPPSQPHYVFAFQDWDIPKATPGDRAASVPDQRHLVHPTSSHEMPSFGLTMQKARIKKRMTILEVANAVKAPVNSITLFENGVEVPRGELLANLSRVLDL